MFYIYIYPSFHFRQFCLSLNSSPTFYILPMPGEATSHVLYSFCCCVVFVVHPTGPQAAPALAHRCPGTNRCREHQLEHKRTNTQRQKGGFTWNNGDGWNNGNGWKTWNKARLKKNDMNTLLVEMETESSLAWRSSLFYHWSRLIHHFCSFEQIEWFWVWWEYNILYPGTPGFQEYSTYWVFLLKYILHLVPSRNLNICLCYIS